jgi:hypothetical protein
MPIPLGVLAVAGAGAAGGGNSFDLLETTLISTNTDSVTFSNLGNYSAYKHLQIRMTLRNAALGEPGSLLIRFNGDSGSNYARHILFGNGTTVTSSASSSASSISTNYMVPSNDFPANVFGSYIIDILDFSNSSKNTTIRALWGFTATSASYDEDHRIALQSGLWNNTAAVTSILIDPFSDIAAGSRLSLYGIK